MEAAIINEGSQSGPVSRILSRSLVAKSAATTISLGRSVARRLKHPTRSVAKHGPDFRAMLHTRRAVPLPTALAHTPRL